jgi:ssDNA-binding Zn-finger/Zn-ribbon topoisomerase 1
MSEYEEIKPIVCPHCKKRAGFDLRLRWTVYTRFDGILTCWMLQCMECGKRHISRWTSPF